MKHTIGQLDLTGGESVYCINTFQMDKADELYRGDDESSARVRDAIARLESDCSRNERAAIAMLLLRRLKAPSPAGSVSAPG